MELNKALFNAYFKKQMSLEVLIEKIGIYEKDFSSYLLSELVKTFKSQDAEYLGYLIYTLFLWDERLAEDKGHKMDKYIDILNELLISPWHYKHEDIVLLLQNISSDKSIKYLYDAIELHPEYLAWDYNNAFEVRCVRAIYHIGKDKSYTYLEKLCQHSNPIIREMSQRQIKKLQ